MIKALNEKKIKILFLCMGNICRSPTAEAIARRKVERAGVAHRFEFDSAGTHGYHIGDAPDHRAIATGAKRGYDLSPLRARQVDAADFLRFDWLLVMDDLNYECLARICPQGHEGRLRYLLDFAPGVGRRDVPDPYYGALEDFDEVIDLAEQGIDGLLADLGK